MSKVYSPDGTKVAVLVSYGYGAGWSTWVDVPEDEHKEFILYGDERLIKMIQERDFTLAEEYVKSVVGADAYFGGLDEVVVEWVDVGTKFYIHEYDGAESIVTIDDIMWETA